jgi:hypothetical protein
MQLLRFLPRLPSVLAPTLVISSPSLHHQGLSQLKQLAAGTEITQNPRLLLKQEGTSKAKHWGKKIQKKSEHSKQR